MTRDPLDGGFFIFVQTPSGHCMNLHVQEADLMDEGEGPYWDPFDPGEGEPHGNFTDFTAGGGVPEFGLATPSGGFVGHSPNCHDG